MNLRLYTDGSAGRQLVKGGKYPLGFGAVLVRGPITCELADRKLSRRSCSQQAELLAISLGLSAVPRFMRRRIHLELFCDSESVITALQGGDGIPKHKHLIHQLRGLISHYSRVEIRKIRSGEDLNRRANRLAYRAMRGRP